MNKSLLAKATSAKGIDLNAAYLGSFLNFAQLACSAKFKIEPKCAEVKETLLTEVASEIILNWTWVFSCTCSCKCVAVSAFGNI